MAKDKSSKTRKDFKNVVKIAEEYDLIKKDKKGFLSLTKTFMKNFNELPKHEINASAKDLGLKPLDIALLIVVGIHLSHSEKFTDEIIDKIILVINHLPEVKKLEKNIEIVPEKPNYIG